MSNSQENEFYKTIREILSQARQKTYAAINFAMVEAYWLIGKRIVEQEQQGRERAGYGEYLIKSLAKELKGDWGNGFSVANLKNFRQFYQTFPDFEKSYALRSQLTWSHYRLIMRVDNLVARDFYINESVDQKWSTRTLGRNINSLLYERMLSNQNANSTVKTATPTKVTLPRDFIKDPYVLEFLDLPETPWPQERWYSIILSSNALYSSISKLMS